MNYTRTLCIVVDMIDNKDNRLLMSDSLKGMVPTLEDEVVDRLQDSFVIVSLETSHDVKGVDILSGVCAGVSFEDASVKVDLRIELLRGYDFLKRILKESVVCNRLYLSRNDDVVELIGPYRLVSPRLTDFDYQDSLCTMGIDLFKI